MNDKQKQLWATLLVALNSPFWLINKCIHRMQVGCEKYGEFNPEKDRRNLYIETEKELLDAINYMLMSGTQNSDIVEELIQLTIKVRERR